MDGVDCLHKLVKCSQGPFAHPNIFVRYWNELLVAILFVKTTYLFLFLIQFRSLLGTIILNWKVWRSYLLYDSFKKKLWIFNINLWSCVLFIVDQTIKFVEIGVNNIKAEMNALLGKWWWWLQVDLNVSIMATSYHWRFSLCRNGNNFQLTVLHFIWEGGKALGNFCLTNLTYRSGFSVLRSIKFPLYELLGHYKTKAIWINSLLSSNMRKGPNMRGSRFIILLNSVGGARTDLHSPSH